MRVKDRAARAWREELSRALDHAADHLSLYQLTIEEGTPFAARYGRGTLRVPDGDAAARSTSMAEEAAGSGSLLTRCPTTRGRLGEPP